MLATGLGFRPALVPRGASVGIRGAGCQPLRKLGLRHAAAAAAPPPAPTPSTLPDSHGPPPSALWWLDSAAQEQLYGCDIYAPAPPLYKNDLSGWCSRLLHAGVPLVVGVHGCFFVGTKSSVVFILIGLSNLFLQCLFASQKRL